MVILSPRLPLLKGIRLVEEEGAILLSLLLRSPDGLKCEVRFGELDRFPLISMVNN